MRENLKRIFGVILWLIWLFIGMPLFWMNSPPISYIAIILWGLIGIFLTSMMMNSIEGDENGSE